MDQTWPVLLFRKSVLKQRKFTEITNLPTHTEILHCDMAVLAPPFPEGFSNAMLQLIADETLREKVGRAGKQLIDSKYTFASFREKINGMYDWLEQEIGLTGNLSLSAPLTHGRVGGGSKSAFRQGF
jgi:hypothetical protein